MSPSLVDKSGFASELFTGLCLDKPCDPAAVSTAAADDNRGMPEPLAHIAFYRFVVVPDPAALATELRAVANGFHPGFGGSILVAAEGLNGAVAGKPEDVRAFEAALTSSARFGGLFTGLMFKRSPSVAPPFGRYAVHVKTEIVALGGGLPSPVESQAPQVPALSPAEWRALMADERTLLLDNRNRFEHRQGHFRGAMEPPVGNFREFAQWVEAQAPQWRADRKRVAMYCTGGIRCEKAAPWMAALGLDLVQLDGGILNFLQSMPDAQRDWEGDCVVFDRRLSLDTKLQETGTLPEAIYRADEPDEAWRLARAQRLGLGA
jgi:UPF0176 protein